MVQAQLIKYAIIAAIVLGTVGGIWLKIKTLTSQRDEARQEVVQVKGELEISRQQLLLATQDKDALISSMEKAQQARAVIQAQLDTTLRKLRNQKPPVECKAAIDWAVDNKDDLQWSK